MSERERIEPILQHLTECWLWARLTILFFFKKIYICRCFSKFQGKKCSVNFFKKNWKPFVFFMQQEYWKYLAILAHNPNWKWAGMEFFLHHVSSLLQCEDVHCWANKGRGTKCLHGQPNVSTKETNRSRSLHNRVASINLSQSVNSQSQLEDEASILHC